MTSLDQIIIDRIRAEGPLNFEAFMETALYYPALGYYTKESSLIGRAGDFYTSPHVHALFGATLGRQLEEMWRLLGRPTLFQAVEMGAGMGYLAKDLLDSLKDRELYRHLAYTIIELNPAMRQRQQELLQEHAGRVAWAAEVRELPPITGCFLSNELLDAFPVRLVEGGDGLREVYVTYTGEGGFSEITTPCSPEVAAYFDEFSITLPAGYRTEANLRIGPWLRQIAGRLAEGFVLTIDYGYSAEEYYSEERSRGTLLCYYRHQVNEDPYRHIGEQDMTAHVNFSALKKWGERHGLKTVGFCPQGSYLVAAGIDELITAHLGAAPDPFELAKVKKLLFPQGLGATHHVLAQHKGEGAAPLRGFSFRNKANRL